MLIDLTLCVTPAMARDMQGNASYALYGHLGTHFDVMDQSFPLDYTECCGIVFDVRGITERDIDLSDIDLSAVREGMFVAFHTGHLSRTGYGSAAYRHEHPQLSDALIDALLERGVSIIGIDAGGIRRGKEHTPADQRCADRGTFVVENLCCLELVLAAGGQFTACTYPMHFSGLSGLPCRVIARI